MHHVTRCRLFRLFLRLLSNTVQSYNIITIYASIIVLKNVNRQRKVILYLYIEREALSLHVAPPHTTQYHVIMYARAYIDPTQKKYCVKICKN